MNEDIVLYILGVMIFWDLSIHIIELRGWNRKFINSRSLFSYYYPHFRWKKTPHGPVERANWELLYQRFWVIFWSVALVLLTSYLLL